MENKPINNLAVPIAIVLAGAMVAGAVLFTSAQEQNTNVAIQGNPSQQRPSAPPVDINQVKIQGEPFIGNLNAPITVAYWSDYQCPFCKRFESDAISQLMNDYVQSGKVKIVFKDFQFLGNDSQTAGLAARAVWELAPEKYSEWHKAMFEKQDSENSGWGNKADILALTKSLGIDSAKVAQLMSNNAVEYQKAIDADKAEGGVLGINGTPGTIIGKSLISGAQPYAVVKQTVEKELKK